MPWQTTIQTRLTIAFFGLAIGPLLLVGVLLAWQSFATQKAQALELQRELARRASGEVVAFISVAEAQLDTEVRDIGSQDQSDDSYIHTNLSRLLANADVFEELTLMDSRGQELDRVSRREPVSPAELGDRSGDDEFLLPMASGDVYYSPVSFDQRNGEPVMTLAVPLIDSRSAQVTRVLAAEIRLKKVWDLVADIRVGDSGSAFIVNPEGEVVAHRNPSVVLSGTSFALPDDDGIHDGLAGGNVVLASEPIRLGSQTLHVVVERPLSEALAPTIRSVLTIAGLLVSALAAAAALAVLAVRRIVRPIQALAATAKTINAGDLSPPIEVHGKDEVGQLADSFRMMVSRLKGAFGSLQNTVAELKDKETELKVINESLEERVAERTQALSKSNASLEAEIAERKQAEKKVGEMASFAEMNPAPVLRLDRHGTILLMNPAAQKLFDDADPSERSWQFLCPGLKQDAFERLFQGLGKLQHEQSIGEKSYLFTYRSHPNRAYVTVYGADITERKQGEETIRRLAYHDVLTGLPNRALFVDRLTLALAHARRNEQMLAVMFVDLDRFKLVNDTAGHTQGDVLLQRVAKELGGLIRESDTVARMGGDEFTLLLPEIDGVGDAIEAAQRILKALRQPQVLAGHEFHITPSIGITIFPGDGDDPETLLTNADMAMYNAKEQGRNDYQQYTPAMSVSILERLALENDLRHGLEREQFVVYYQPLVNISTGQVVGVEALLRWQHPDRGLVMPTEFIPVADETGLIVPVGEWVLRTACAQTKAWQEEGFSSLQVAVNLSTRQFQQRDLAEKVIETLRETNLDPRCLQLEITESVAIQDVDYTIMLLQQLKEMGVQIAIDDFGTGHSALSYLRRFPLDVVKIDRSFIRDLTTNPRDAEIAATVIVMAHNLGLDVIAEGVETEEQLAFLKHRLCDQMQGYLFSRPVPAEELQEILVRGDRSEAA